MRKLVGDSSISYHRVHLIDSMALLLDNSLRKLSISHGHFPSPNSAGIGCVSELRVGTLASPLRHSLVAKIPRHQSGNYLQGLTSVGSSSNHNGRKIMIAADSSRSASSPTLASDASGMEDSELPSSPSPGLKLILDNQREWMWRGIRINYSKVEPQGQGDAAIAKPAVVLVHGFGASIGHWRRYGDPGSNHAKQSCQCTVLNRKKSRRSKLCILCRTTGLMPQIVAAHTGLLLLTV